MNTLEKFFYVSLGLSADLANRLEKTVKRLVEEGKISEIDAKNILENFKNETEHYVSGLKDKFNALIEQTLAKYSFAKQSQVDQLAQRIENLAKRIQQLEEKL